ncbi:uncharacterized protein LOC116413291 isoform X1 [Galleria mellonella]|uniref:Uncharacterized protein LOC116413291 isoform X1 n=1 Tax=Galleria mellonella TaxID=7137 RepID=A0A6J3C8V6_GALME|nr:uncharacterized protein LOC116413291 isoform X1 [Galleria mellonella]
MGGINKQVNILYFFCSFALITKGVSLNKPTAVGDQGDTDGELYVKRIINGEKISDKPSYLLFTAPYRLCKGGCNTTDNFVFAFPLHIGKKGKETYRNLYSKDFKSIHSTKLNAPFRKKTTREPITPCPTLKIEVTNTISPVLIPEYASITTTPKIDVDDNVTTDFIKNFTKQKRERSFENTRSITNTKIDIGLTTITYSVTTTMKPTTENGLQNSTTVTIATETKFDTNATTNFVTNNTNHTNYNFDSTKCPKVSPRICNKRKKLNKFTPDYDDVVTGEDYKVSDVNEILKENEDYLNSYELSTIDYY